MKWVWPPTKFWHTLPQKHKPENNWPTQICEASSDFKNKLSPKCFVPQFAKTTQTSGHCKTLFFNKISKFTLSLGGCVHFQARLLSRRMLTSDMLRWLCKSLQYQPTAQIVHQWTRRAPSFGQVRRNQGLFFFGSSMKQNQPANDPKKTRVPGPFFCPFLERCFETVLGCCYPPPPRAPAWISAAVALPGSAGRPWTTRITGGLRGVCH